MEFVWRKFVTASSMRSRTSGRPRSSFAGDWTFPMHTISGELVRSATFRQMGARAEGPAKLKLSRQGFSSETLIKILVFANIKVSVRGHLQK